MTHKVLIMGGTGVFGKRLARHLASVDGIELYVSSRTAAKAEQFAATLANARGIALDHRTNLQDQLDAIKPFAVIDCSGPFQTASFDTARTIINAGAHLIDLADARDYLANFAPNLDALARKNGVTAMTGASSTPTLSTCVVDHITAGWQHIDTIDICITPGGKSEVGRAVIEAILSYAGKDIPVWRDGQLARATGWSGARNVEIPGLGRRRVALVETYDAENLSHRHTITSRITFAAGLESRIEQRGIETLAWLRKRHLFPNPKAIISLLLQARKITRIPTSDKGGMLVAISGQNADGQRTQARWTLIAQNDHGPTIPVLPAAAALSALLQGNLATGAGFAFQHITLAQILAQMTPYDIATELTVNDYRAV